MSEATPVHKAAKKEPQKSIQVPSHLHLAATADPGGQSSAERMEQTLIENNILPGDPLYPPFALNAELLGKLEVLLERVAAGSDALNAQVRATAEAEVARVRASVASVEEDCADRLTAALEQSVQSVVRVKQWQVAATLACFLCVAIAVGIWVGWYFGWRDGQAHVAALHGQVAEAFRDGDEVAAAWLRLMRDNDLPLSLSQCSGKASYRANGRLACNVPLWLEGPDAPKK